MTPAAVFVQDGDRFTATEIALGPWDAGALHGGAPAALVLHVLAQSVPAGSALRPARITYEFVRPVPRGPLTVEVATVRPGRRVSVLDATIRDGEGVEVTRARALLVAPTELGQSEDGALPFPGPDVATASDWSHGAPPFAVDAMEIRFAAGGFLEPGPATAWFRLRVPLIEGEPVSPLELAAAAGDFGNGIASVLSWDEHVFINPDLTLYFEREPAGEWVALQSRMRVVPGSVALAESDLWDERGRIGRATQSLVVGPRPRPT